MAYQAPTAIGQIAIPVQNIERATAFYREVLGLRFLFSAPPGLALLRVWRSSEEQPLT